MIKSRALEVNLARTQVEVAIDPRYRSLQAVMTPYYGLLEGLNGFLREVSHPYKNWQFIVSGARGYALDYFHLMRSHPDGPAAAQRLAHLFFEVLAADTPVPVKVDAADNLILFLEKIIQTAGDRYDAFASLVNVSLDRIRQLPDPLLALFVRSFYGIKRLALGMARVRGDQTHGFAVLNRLLVRHLESGL
ncbi:MAG: pyruvate, phosphate dikinase, partial [Desulfatitalea sp.]|nr:pyruvate, phosphate dikinase [Desulfatitalea sp.]